MKNLILIIATLFNFSLVAQVKPVSTVVIPTQAGNAGKYLKTNGSKMSWFSIPTPTYAPGVSAALTGSGTVGFLPKYSSANTFTNSIIFDSNSNIGIGTSSPIAKLDVNGSIISAGGRHGALIIGTYPYVSGLSNEMQGNPLIFNYTNGFDAGMGTNSPTAKFHIKGSSSTSAMYALKVDNSSSSPLLHIRNDELFTIGSVGGSSRANVNLGNSQQFNINANDYATFTMSDGNVEWFRISPTTYNEANISSSGILTIYGGGANTLYTRWNESSGGVGFNTQNPSARIHVVGSNSTSSNYALKVDNSSSSPLLYVRNDGNVGIGTSSPKAKLQVVGLAEYADNAAAITAGLTVGAFYRTGDLLKVVH
jgi:hypothetical protein